MPSLKVNNYLLDGAGMQARCVLIYLQSVLETKHYDRTDVDHALNNIYIARFNNGREQGYFLTANARVGEGLTIAFAENRSSDHIVVYDTNRYNIVADPTLDLLWPEPCGAAPRTKYFPYEAYSEAATYIIKLIQDLNQGIQNNP